MYLHACHYYFSLLPHCYDAELHVTCSAECLVAVYSFLYLCILEHVLKHSLSLNLHLNSLKFVTKPEGQRALHRHTCHYYFVLFPHCHDANIHLTCCSLIFLSLYFEVHFETQFAFQHTVKDHQTKHNNQSIDMHHCASLVMVV